MLEMIGRIMIVSTTIAVKMFVPDVGGAEERDEAERRVERRDRRGRAGTGARTSSPHSPMITLGIAASVSTSAVTGPRIQLGRELAEVERDTERERRRDKESAEAR